MRASALKWRFMLGGGRPRSYTMPLPSTPPPPSPRLQIGVAGGVETMSNNPMTWEGGINPRLEQFPQAAACLMPMGVTSENVAEKFGVDRKTQVSGWRGGGGGGDGAEVVG